MQRLRYSLAIILLSASSTLSGQDLYSARAYWEEVNKDSYRKLKVRELKGDSLTANEKNYARDYEAYLATYYSHLSDAEKQKYEQMKAPWEVERATTKTESNQTDFELRPRDRFRNGIYGLYYGIAMDNVFDITGTAATGIPLIMAGVWQLGPIINPKKYEGITAETIRAGNTGKILGLGYGLGLGLAIGGQNASSKLMLGLSSIGSIALGEIAFQNQKKKPRPGGDIEIIRHYGFLGPIVVALGVGAAGDVGSNTIGATLVGGGVAGFLIGNSVSKKYAYSVGDARVVSSLSWISAGVGTALMIESYRTSHSTSRGLLFIPAATTVLGTVVGQNQVKGIHLTQKQGSTLSLSSGGAALIGLGIVVMTKTESAGVIVGAPAVAALITHQLLLSSFRKQNVGVKVGTLRKGARPMNLSLDVTPENYIIAQQPASLQTENVWPPLVRPIATIRVRF